ncbi:MAG: hypothetical protein L0Z50_01895 [Verrucomicrobiales bacterium]|nr:hypothetical protein [Verrucomicrobiales bacterium]
MVPEFDGRARVAQRADNIAEIEVGWISGRDFLSAARQVFYVTNAAGKPAGLVREDDLFTIRGGGAEDSQAGGEDEREREAMKSQNASRCRARLSQLSVQVRFADGALDTYGEKSVIFAKIFRWTWLIPPRPGRLEALPYFSSG